jgi:hypothetical protein
LRDEYTCTLEPARALAAGALILERSLSDFVNQAYGLTPAEIALMWQTAPPRMPIPVSSWHAFLLALTELDSNTRVSRPPPTFTPCATNSPAPSNPPAPSPPKPWHWSAP